MYNGAHGPVIVLLDFKRQKTTPPPQKKKDINPSKIIIFITWNLVVISAICDLSRQLFYYVIKYV